LLNFLLHNSVYTEKFETEFSSAKENGWLLHRGVFSFSRLLCAAKRLLFNKKQIAREKFAQAGDAGGEVSFQALRART
jgi:hypothetical protein